jgi:hypothetical protein
VTDQELARAAARRLAIIGHAQEVTGNVPLRRPSSGSLDYSVPHISGTK